jgi:hypothetical protein
LFSLFWPVPVVAVTFNDKLNLSNSRRKTQKMSAHGRKKHQIISKFMENKL